MPYDSRWTKQYEKEKSVLTGILKEKAVVIEHIGSTSIKGGVGKTTN